MDTSHIKSVLTVSTSIEMGCPICNQWLGGTRFDESVQHMLDKHGYALLHVGSETSNDGEGKPWHSTVAVVGSINVPPSK